MYKKRNSTIRRRRNGALAAEYVTTLYVLFFFLVFPLLNYAVLGLRAFFLWFACNQAAMTGSKCRTLCQPITIGGVQYSGAAPTAVARANNIAAAFPGIHWQQNEPEIWVFVNQIPGAPPTNGFPTSWQVTNIYTGPTMNGVPNLNSYIFEFRVIIRNAWIDPLIAVPWLNNIPGLGSPVYLTVESSTQFENPPGLTM